MTTVTMGPNAITLNEIGSEAEGTREVRLESSEGSLWLVEGAERRRLPPGAVAAVMDRYGKALDEDVVRAQTTSDGHHQGVNRARTVESLVLGEGAELVRMRYLARFDVIARDWLVLHRPDREPVCELAIAVTGALGHLARAYERSLAG